MAQGRNTIRLNLRLNLENEQHLRVYEILSDLDKDIYKSKIQYIITAIDEYEKSLRERARQKKKVEETSYAEEEAYRQEIKNMVRNEVLQMLGAVIAGRERVIETREEISKEAVHEEEQQELSENAKDLISLWSQ